MTDTPSTGRTFNKRVIAYTVDSVLVVALFMDEGRRVGDLLAGTVVRPVGGRP